MALTKYRHIYTSLILLTFCLVLTKCVPLSEDSSVGRPANTLLADDPDSLYGDPNLDKRMERYAFGLGRRAYTYTAGGAGGVKRLPIYNFGLGKRMEEQKHNGIRYRFYIPGMDKRYRPYSFGLGKRDNVGPSYDFGLNDRNADDDSGASHDFVVDHMDKRSAADVGFSQRYGFGLGKRSPDEIDYAQRYGFGLGKR